MKTWITICFVVFLSSCADTGTVVVLQNPTTKQSVQCGFVTAGGIAWTEGCVKAYKDAGYVVTNIAPSNSDGNPPLFKQTQK